MDGGDSTDYEGIACNQASICPSSPPAGGISESDLAAAEAAAAHGAAAAAAKLVADGLRDKMGGMTSVSTFSTAAMSNNSISSTGMYYSVEQQQRSSSPLSCRVCSTTLSPLGSPGSDRPQHDGGESGVEGERGGVREMGNRERIPSLRTLQELERVKGQLSDALRALAVSFGQVGYCQGEEGGMGWDEIG